MNPKRTRLIVFLVMLSVAAGCGSRGADPAEESGSRPAKNLVLVTLDTVRADFLGAYGHPDRLTLHLDALASRGLVFANAYSTAPFTGPAHASILTGQHPSTHGIIYNGHRVAADIEDTSVTLAEHLSNLGFKTGAVVSSGVVSAKFGFGRGFDWFRQIEEAQPEDKGGWAGFVTDAAIDWLRLQKGERFFLWLHFIEPHLPYVVGVDVAERLNLEDRNVPIDVGKTLPTQRLRRVYGGDLFETDRELGRFLNHLKISGLDDDTLMVVTADHGEYLHEHGGMMDHSQLFDQVLHVPLIFAGPGVPIGERRSDVVSVVDIVPSLLETMQLTKLPTAQGVSLWHAGEREPHPVFAEWRSYRMVTMPERSKPSVDFLLSVQLGDTKLIRPVLMPERTMVFSLSEDPLETENLVTRSPGLADRLSTILDEHLAEDLPRGLLGVENVHIDDSSAEMLRALGYIE